MNRRFLILNITLTDYCSVVVNKYKLYAHTSQPGIGIVIVGSTENSLRIHGSALTASRTGLFLAAQYGNWTDSDSGYGWNAEPACDIIVRRGSQ